MEPVTKLHGRFGGISKTTLGLVPHKRERLKPSIQSGVFPTLVASESASPPAGGLRISHTGLNAPSLLNPLNTTPKSL